MNWYRHILKLADKKDYLIQQGIPKDIVDWAESLSRQINNKLTYLEWVSRLAQKNIIIPNEDDSKVITTLQLFDKLKNINKIDKKNINQFKSYGELSQYLEPFKGQDTESQRGKEKRLGNEGYQVIPQEESERVEVIKIDTEQAASKLCRNTDWCIKDPKFFNEYGAPFFMFVLDGEPHALLHAKSGQFKDKYDDDMDEESIEDIYYPVFHVIKQYNIPLSDELEIIYDVGNSEEKALLYPNRVEGYKKILLENPKLYKNVSEFKNAPGVKDAVQQGWKNYILKSPYDYSYIPEEFKNSEMENIAIEWFKNNLSTNSEYVSYVPQEILEKEELQNIIIKAWENNLLTAPESYNHLVPDNIKNLPEINMARIKGWKNHVLNNPNDYGLIPDDIKQYIPDLNQQQVVASYNWYKKAQLNFQQGQPIRFINPLTGQQSSGVFDAIFESGMNQGKARVRIGNLTGRPVVVPIGEISLITNELQSGQVVNLPNYPTESPAEVIENLGNGKYSILPRSKRKMILPINEISF